MVLFSYWFKICLVQNSSGIVKIDHIHITWGVFFSPVHIICISCICFKKGASICHGNFWAIFSGASNTVPQQSARRRPFLDALIMISLYSSERQIQIHFHILQGVRGVHAEGRAGHLPEGGRQARPRRPLRLPRPQGKE